MSYKAIGDADDKFHSTPRQNHKDIYGDAFKKKKKVASKMEEPKKKLSVNLK